MPPEQARGEANQVGHQADIYSLGVILFQLLTGELPFRGNTRMLLHQVLHEDAPSPRRLNNRISKDLETICLKCLQKKPEARYQSAKAVADELDRYLTNRPILARPVSRLSRLLSAAQRNKVTTSLALVAASLLVAIAVVSSISAITFKVAEEEARKEKRKAVYSQYTSNIQAANSLLREDDTLLARRVVEHAPAEHRNFEWALLANQAWPKYQIGDFTSSGAEKWTASEIWERGRLELLQEILPWDASGGTQGGFFSSRGDSVFVYLTNGDVRQFSIGSGKPLPSYETTVGHSIAVALSPDGSRLGAISFSSRGTVWNVDANSIVAKRDESLEAASSPWVCRWSPDNEYLVSGHMDGTVRIWDGGSLALLATCKGHKKNAVELSISPTSDAVWSASTDGSIRAWSLPAGTRQGEFRVPVPGDLELQTISPSGKLAFALYTDGSHLIWEIETEQVVNDLSGPIARPHKGATRFCAAFSPDERLLAVAATNRSITVYDLETGRTLHEFRVPLLALRTLAFSPDGTQLLAVTEDGKAKIFGCVLRSSPELSSAHTDVIYQMDVADTGNLILAGSFDGTASVWNLGNQEQVSIYDSHDAEIVAVDLSRDGTRAATLDATGTLHVWDTMRSETIFATRPDSDEFSKHIGRSGGGLRGNVLNYSAVLSTGIFSPDDTRLVAYHQGNMTVFDARTGKVEAILEGATSSGWPIYSHDSSLVSVLEMNSRVADVWDLETGKRVTQLKGHRNHLVMMNFSPVDHTVVTAGMGSKITVWNAQTGRKIRVLDEKGGDCTCCRFSSDGHYILAGYTDSAVRIWDAQSGKLVTKLLGHNIRVRDVRLSPDKTRILTCGMDDKAMIWDFAPDLAHQLAVVEGDSKLLQARWGSEGRCIITAWSDGGIRFWRGATKQDLEQFKQGKQPFEQGFESWRERFMHMSGNSNR